MDCRQATSDLPNGSKYPSQIRDSRYKALFESLRPLAYSTNEFRLQKIMSENEGDRMGFLRGCIEEALSIGDNALDEEESIVFRIVE